MVSITDANGAQANSYVYKAFGELRSQSGSLANAWLYTGRQYDLENGLYFYRSRYYDARVGRFTTRDPIGISGGINLYTYCLNNPGNLVDPFGLCPERFQANPVVFLLTELELSARHRVSGHCK